jgi:hypothetical protein
VLNLCLGWKIGMLGRTGPSGNFSQLHLGAYLSEQDDGAPGRAAGSISTGW